jgi:hypothetical protein
MTRLHTLKYVTVPATSVEKYFLAFRHPVSPETHPIRRANLRRTSQPTVRALTSGLYVEVIRKLAVEAGDDPLGELARP